jgi:hypothetical protein
MKKLWQLSLRLVNNLKRLLYPVLVFEHVHTISHAQKPLQTLMCTHMHAYSQTKLIADTIIFAHSHTPALLLAAEKPLHMHNHTHLHTQTHTHLHAHTHTHLQYC